MAESNSIGSRWWEADEVTLLSGVFEGGGAKGIAYGGALQAVHSANCWFSAVAGASAGAITAALVAAGLRPDEIAKLTPVALQKIRLRPVTACLRRMKRTSGYVDTTELREWLSEVLTGQYEVFTGHALNQQSQERRLAELGGVAPATSVTFEELKAATGIQLHVVAADLSDRAQIVFNSYETPSCSVVDAVIASSSIPFLFKNADVLVEHEIHAVVDGGVWSNFPMFVFSESYRNWWLDRITLLQRSHIKENPPEGIPEIVLDELSKAPVDESNALVVGFVLDEHPTVDPVEVSREMTRSVDFAGEDAYRELHFASLYHPSERSIDDRSTKGGIRRWPRVAFERMVFVFLRAGPQAVSKLSHGRWGVYKARWPEPRAASTRWLVGWLDDIAGTLFHTPVLLLVWLSLLLTVGLGIGELFRLAEPVVNASGDWLSELKSLLTLLWLLAVAVAAVTLGILSIVGFLFASISLRSLRRLGYGLARTYVAGTSAPPWMGFAKNEHVIRLPIRHNVSTLSFELNEKQLTAVQQDAFKATQKALADILATRP